MVSLDFSMQVFGLILGGGTGKRFGSDKLQCKVGAETVLERSYRILDESSVCDSIFTVTSGEYTTPIPSLVKVGATRFESLCFGVEKILKKALSGKYADAYVMIHNAANPGMTVDDIKKCLKAAIKSGACGVAHRINDTVRLENDRDFKILNRENLWAMQTPQCIRLDLLLKGISFIKSYNSHHIGSPILPTDDLQILDLINQNRKDEIAYRIIPASETNFKITTKGDLKKMRAVLGLGNAVGVGQDSHEFSDTGFLTLGGTTLKDFPKLKAASDGDVILHAIFNAVSSTLGEGSIGQTADKMHAKGVKDSRKYLDVTLREMQNRGYEIGNISISLTCKKPKVDKIEKSLKKRLGEILNIKTTLIGITATSGEGLYNENSIACTCMVSLV